MLVRLVLWNLADSKTTIGELRRYLRDESVDAFEEVPGLRFKAWIADEATERWGAVYLWESREAADQTAAEPGARADREGAGRRRGVRRRGDDRGRLRNRRALAPRARVRVALSTQSRDPWVRISGIRSNRGGGHGNLRRVRVVSRGRGLRGTPRRPRSARSGRARGRSTRNHRAALPRPPCRRPATA